MEARMRSRLAQKIAADHEMRRVIAHLQRTAGWWAIKPGKPGISPPPVDKGGLLNAVPGTDPAEASLYNGDWPADLMGDALEDIDRAYRQSWGRAAKPEELKAVFEFVFGPIKDGISWPKNEWIDEAVEILGVPMQSFMALPKESLDELEQAHRDYRNKSGCADQEPTELGEAQDDPCSQRLYERFVDMLEATWRMKNQDVERLLKRASADDGKKTGDRTGVGFFIPVPKDLADQFPPLGDEDKSKPHATFLYIGNVPKEQEEAFLKASQEAFSEIREPVRAHLHGPEYFVHPDKGRRVALMGLRYSHDMAGLRWKLRDKLIDAGIQVDDKFPLIYRPHVTLAYLDGLTSVFKGDVPKGDWEFDGIEVWGLPKLHTIPFGSATSNRVASKHLAGMTDQASRALMKFLSEAAKKLGVAKDTYVVGGAVRNFVIDQPIKDIDVVIDSIASGRDSEWFAKKLQGLIPVMSRLTTNRYGVAILTIKGDWDVGGANLNGEVIEIANARKESYGGEAGKGYKPHMVEPATIEEDVVRREFTFNTLMWRLLDLAKGPDKAEIIDITGCGLRDLQEGVARCPLPPDKVFSDDPSRMIRAIKFLLKYGLKIAPDVEASIKRNKQKLHNIPAGHLSNMIIGMFYEGGVGKKALAEMDRLGLLDVVKDIARKDTDFRLALGNWADRKADVEFLFDLMDFGMPSGKRLNFLDARLRPRVREITVQMSAREARAFVDILHKPGSILDMKTLGAEFGLRGKDFQKITEAARSALLADPVLAANPRRLEDKVRQVLSKGGRVATQKTALRGPEPHPEWMVWLGTPMADQYTHYLMDVKDDEFVHFTTNRRARLILADGKLKMNPPYKKFGTDNVTAVSSRWGHFVPRVQTTHIKPEKGEKLVAITFQTPTVPKYGYPEEVVWNRDVVLKNAKMIPFEKGVSMLKKTPYRLPVRDEDDIVYYQIPPEVRGGKVAATFNLNVGDSILYGKYKNKKGIIKSFSTNEKGDVLVTIEPYPKGRKQDKELKLFKIRPAPEPWPVEKEASAESVALKHQERLARKKKAIRTNPANMPQYYEDFFELWKVTNAFLDDMIQKGIPLDNHQVKRTFKRAWGGLILAGRRLAEGVLDLKHIPEKKHKELELAARHFMAARRPPRNPESWRVKTERFAKFFKETRRWKDKAEGGDEMFKLGPFMVHNTVGLTGKKLENIKKALTKAAKLIRASKAPATLKKTLYGDVFIVPQLQRGKIMAWYNPGRDDFYVRPFARYDMDVVHNIIHELSHRWWKRFSDKSAQREWLHHHTQVGMKTPEIEMPGVGDPLPVKMRKIKGPFIADDMDDQSYWFTVSIAGQDRHLSVPIREIRRVLTKSARANKNYPTPYSSTDPEEHFAEATAMSAMKKLPAEHQEDFDRIWGGGGGKTASTNVKYTELKLDDEDGKEIGSWVIPEDSVPLLISDAPLVENVADRFASRMASRVAAKYQKKKEVPKADGNGTTTVYEYSEKQVQHRNREKAKRVEKLRGKLDDLQKKVKKDLKSDDLKTRLTALAVGLINDTYERVGNPDSAKDGHFGVTGWQAKHVTIAKGDDKATIKYIGKSGVNQEKETRDPDIIRVLKEAVKDKSGTDPVFEVDDVKVDSTVVNDYLKPMDITAKDIRGLHANRVMQNKLQAIRKKGDPAPGDTKEREKQFKEEFKKALEETAKEVGHEPSTLKSQYLVPGLEDTYLSTGQVKKNLAKQASGGGFAEAMEIIDHYRQEFEDILAPQASRDKTAIININNATDGDEDEVELRGFNGLISSLTLYEQAVVQDMHSHNEPILTEDGSYTLRGHQVEPGAVRELIGAGYLQEDGDVVRLSDMFEVKNRLYRSATKTHAEKEDEAIADLVKPAPKFKPPRKDLKKERVDLGDDDTDEGTAEKEKDLSLNYKRVALRWIDRLAGKVPADSKDKKPGDYWQKDNGEWGVKLPDGNHTQAKDEEHAAALAAGKVKPGEEDEEKTEKGEGGEEISLSLAEKSKALSDAEKAKGEELTPEEKTEIEEDALAQKAQRLEEEAQKKKEESEKKGLQADIDKIDNVARQVGDTNFAAELRGVDNDEDKRAILMAYSDELEKLQKGVFSGDALAEKTINEATKALKKDTFGQGMNLRDSAKALAAKTLAKKVVSNPTVVGGTKVNDQPKDAETLRARTNQAFEEYSKMTPELRGAAIEQMAKLLEDEEDENKALELQHIANGLAMAALINDEPITPVREEPGDEMRALVKALHKKGDAMKLVGMSTDEFYSPEGREMVSGVMDDLSDDELFTLVGGESGKYGQMIKAIQDKKSEEGGEAHAKVLISLLKDLHLDGMTSIHAFLTETAKKGKNGTDDQDEVNKKVKAVEKAFPDDGRLAKAQQELVDCLNSAEGDPEKIKKCHDIANKVRVTQVEAAREIAKEIMGEPTPGSPLDAQMRDTVEEGNSSNLEKKYIPQGKEAQSFASSPKVFQSSFYTWGLISEGQVCARAETPRMETRRRNQTMAKKLTKKGAQAVTADLDKLATLFEHDYEILGVEERIAHDFALRCDMLSDHLEKVALTGDDVVKEQGFDPDDIGRETAGPLENEPDEPYMRGEFDQQENRELREKQQGGEIGPDRMTTEPQTPRPGVQAALGTLAAAIGDGTLPKEASAQVEKALGLATKIVREAKKDLPPEFLKNIEKKKEEAKDKDEGKDKKAADDSEEEAAESMQEKKEEEAKEEKKASHGYDLTAE